MTALGRYLLDTTVLIDVSKEIEPTSSQVRDWLAGPDDVGICGVVVAEFFSGLPPEERQTWESFIDRLAFWDVTQRIAIEAGMYRFQFARLGTTLSTTDALIAAVAFNIGATLVTRNIKDFPMVGLSLMQVG